MVSIENGGYNEEDEDEKEKEGQTIISRIHNSYLHLHLGSRNSHLDGVMD